MSKDILRRMSEVAPGTFQHSIQVGNLAAEIANKIGAKAQLVRTGALYHDIGKTQNPIYFTENQSGVNPHESLSYIDSAQVIISHVTDGLKLADKHNLPDVIKDFIATHHGQGKAKYFYVKYKNEHPDEMIDDLLFTYPGPNPFTREQAVLMMADAVEAASRSLPDYTEQSIRDLVNRILDSQVAEGYFRECPITFRDIQYAKTVLIEKLKTIYHLFFYLFTFLPLTIDAAPAWPFPFQVKQPDGTMLTILLHGDEHFHWVTTADDGVLLVSKDNAYYVADIDASGKLTATTLLAHDPIKRTTTELTAIERQAPRRALFIEQGTARMEQARRAQSISTAGGYFPHIGNPRVLIILAAYTDKDFTVENPKETFDDYFNGDKNIKYVANSKQNICSVAKYFETVSDGKYKPQFDVVGPVTLPKDMNYYGYGGGNPNNEKLKQLCEDACNLVKDSVDFKNYDNDGDNKAELIYILHAGYGENTGGPEETMWAKCGTINIEINGTTIMRGGCHSELLKETNLNGIGPFIHEFSHGMGLPDIYSTTAAAQKYINQNMQSWDVMDYGIYSGNGYAPAAYTAWEQEVFGWITIKELTESDTHISATPLLANGTAYKIQNPQKTNEFIVLENIQKTSLNSAARGHGLLAYHIDYASNTVGMSDSPNNIQNHPRVAVIPSGGLQFSTTCIDDVTYTSKQWVSTHAATPFPGTNNVTTLTDEQELPNFCFYAGNPTTKNPVGHSLFNIREENGVITFDYDEDSATGIGSLTPALSQEEGAWYTLDGRRLSGEPKQKGIFIHQGKKVIK